MKRKRNRGFLKILSTLLCAVILLVALPASDATAIDISGTPFTYGDVDLSGSVNAVDALRILNASIGTVQLYGLKKTIANVDLDYSVTAVDSLKTLQMSISGVPYSELPTGLYRTSDIADFGYTDISENDHRCYNQLSAIQKTAYNTIVNKALTFYEGLFIVGFTNDGFTRLDAKAAYNAVIRDNPYYFWIPSSYAIASSYNNGTAVAIAMKYPGSCDYNYTYNQVKQYQLDIGIAVNVVFNEVLRPGMTQAEIALALHDYLIKTMVYDIDSANDLENNPDALTIYKAMMQDTAVCEGISKTYQLLLYKAGIDCTCVVSDYHMWNAVEIDGVWYYTDVTWDDPDRDDVYYYFSYNQTYEQIERSHPTMSINITDFSQINSISPTPDDWNYNLPETTDLTENWYYKNNLYYEDWDDFDANFPARLAQLAQEGTTRVQFMVKTASITAFNQFTGHVSQATGAANRLITDYSKLLGAYTCSYVSDAPGAMVYYRYFNS